MIAVLREEVPTPDPPAGPGDDAAVLAETAGAALVLTTDALVEGVHFLRAHPAEALGYKALAVNLADVGAMGADPLAFLLSVAAPEALPPETWRGFARGLGAAAIDAGVVLLGGDTVRSPGPLMISVTALGRVPAGEALTRSGGRPGDAIMVYGAIGRSALGLRRWLATAPPGWGPARWGPPWDADPCLTAHLRPEPPWRAGGWAREAGATAGMDLSDGLATDLPRLAVASDLILEVDLAHLPDDPACAELSPEERAAGGEDHGLLVLVPPTAAAAFEGAGFVSLGGARARAEGEGPGVLWRLSGRATAPAPAFQHFPGG